MPDAKSEPSPIEFATGADGDAGASPACAMHEADPAYMGFMPDAEIAAFLNVLLEAERAGAKGTRAMLTEVPVGAPGAGLLAVVATDEARFCAMLAGHVTRLGGTPTRATGAFYEKLMASPAGAARFQFLNRGQGWVARKLREALPKIRDDGLRRDLREMLDVHERNIAACDPLAR